MLHQDAAGSWWSRADCYASQQSRSNSLVVRFPRHHQGHLEKRHEKYLPKDKPIST